MSHVSLRKVAEYVRRLTCRHEWHVATGPYDPDQAAACSHNGVRYTPQAYLICSKCQKRRSGLQGSAPIGWQLLGFPLFAVYMLVIMVLTPVLLLIAMIYEALRRPRAA